jgi:hypothetical protein
MALAQLPLAVTHASAVTVSQGTTANINVVEDSSNPRQFSWSTQNGQPLAQSVQSTVADDEKRLKEATERLQKEKDAMVKSQAAAEKQRKKNAAEVRSGYWGSGPGD